jgi:hypothetical protein
MNIIESQNPEESTVVETTNRKWQKTTRDVHFVILELRNLDIVRLW